MSPPLTGLRPWDRDPDLPARAGEPALTAPSGEEVAALVGAHLLAPETRADAGAEVREVDWEYARWKPGVSLTTCHRLHFADGGEELVVLKRYADDKAEVLAARSTPEEIPGLSPRLLPRAVLPERSMVLFAPPADRALGLRFLLDPKRFPKLLRDSGLVEPGLVRRRRTVFELLRYKPERRAVYRVRLRLRDEARTRFSLAVRVLPDEQVATTLAMRRAFEQGGGGTLAPRVACAHPRHGLLVEPWLELATPAPDDFGGAPEAGRLLARLHAIPLSAPRAVDENSGAQLAAALEPRTPPTAEPARLAPLFGEAPELGELLRRLHPPRAPLRRGWVHGDFHPDQVAATPDGPLLLDLDALAQGDPVLDLASWIADHLHHDERLSLEQAAGPLLEGYTLAGGVAPQDERLRVLVACELAARAAASMRRLERGALERARTTLERAAALG